MNKELFQRMIDEGMVSVQKHPQFDLYIYNYTKPCIFSHTWNEVTMQCRGLILDRDMNVIARPMRKFFNYEELDESEIPDLPFKAYDKIDGSMGILYWVGDTPYIATRGSFTSEQAVHATKVYRERFMDVPVDKRYTYIFEIVYPEDSKVVKYGDLDTLVLLAIIDTETGEEKDIKTMSGWFETPREYDADDYRNLRTLFDGGNREGFVVRFSNNFRLKMKYEEYLHIFSLKYCLSEKMILDATVEGRMDDIYSQLRETDEEVRMYVDDVVAAIDNEYASIEMEAKMVFRNDFATRKEAAEYFRGFGGLSGILFMMYGGRDHSQAVWKLLMKRRDDRRKKKQ